MHLPSASASQSAMSCLYVIKPILNCCILLLYIGKINVFSFSYPCSKTSQHPARTYVILVNYKAVLCVNYKWYNVEYLNRTLMSWCSFENANMVNQNLIYFAQNRIFWNGGTSFVHSPYWRYRYDGICGYFGYI